MTKQNIKSTISTATKEKEFPNFAPKALGEYIKAAVASKEAVAKEKKQKEAIVKEATEAFTEYRKSGGQLQTIRAEAGSHIVDVSFKVAAGEVVNAELASDLGLNVTMQRKVEMKASLATLENLEKLIELVGQKRFAEWFTISEKQVVDAELALERFHYAGLDSINSAIKFSQPSVACKVKK